MARRRLRGSQRGFTLIEMMVVVAIIAILSGLVISASGRPVGANARNVSEQIVSTVGFAKLRASATRRVHRIQIQPTVINVWVASNETGLIVSGAVTWELVQRRPLPSGVRVWDVQAGPITGIGTAVSEVTSLDYNLDVRPDGQAIASTIFVTDGKEPWRVLVYHATGGAYARPQW